MDAGKTRLLAGGPGTGLDHGDAGQDVATLGGAASHIAVADPDAGYIGDGVERAGLQLAELDIQVAGTWFHAGTLRHVKQEGWMPAQLPFLMLLQERVRTRSISWGWGCRVNALAITSAEG